MDYKDSDLSEIHPASEPPTKSGWYLTDHCGGALKNLKVFRQIDLVFWDNRDYTWKTKCGAKMYGGAIGCARYCPNIGRWVGLRHKP